MTSGAGQARTGGRSQLGINPDVERYLDPDVLRRLGSMSADERNERLVLLAREKQRIRDSGQVPGIEIGARAPSFRLPDCVGGHVSLAERLAAGPVVLTFYRGGWCPACCLQLHRLQGILSELRELGASLIAISPQAPDASLAVSERLALGFDVLGDLDQSVGQAYRLRFELSEALREISRSVGTPTNERNADGSWRLPVPATFVIDRDGIVTDRHVDVDWAVRMEPEAVLEAVRKLERP